MGAIDVWKCRGCQEIFCEDKRYGVQDLAAEVGFPKVEQGAKWAALVCIKEKGSDWTLTGAKPGTIIHHSCTVDTKVDLTVGSDYSIEPGVASGIGRHRIILLGDFVNSAVDVETGKKHTGPTNANPAPGRPFSFPAEKSAVPTLTSRYNVSNVSAATSFVAGIWAAIIGISSSGTTPVGVLLLLAGLVGIAGSYLTLRLKRLGPMLGIAASLLGILGLLELNLAVNSIGLLAPLASMIVSGAIAWLAWSRIRAQSGQKWHPLDMPAYG